MFFCQLTDFQRAKNTWDKIFIFIFKLMLGCLWFNSPYLSLALKIFLKHVFNKAKAAGSIVKVVKSDKTKGDNGALK